MSPQPRVLCAEPSADICSMLHALLDRHGFDSDSASTIAEAVEKAGGEDYCRYIVDDDYRDGTNVELIRRLRALTPHVPVARLQLALLRGQPEGCGTRRRHLLHRQAGRDRAAR